MDKFKGRYRIPSARRVGWDYGSNAAYFVTLCTAQRAHDFGEIRSGTMHLTPLGHVARQEWAEVPIYYAFVRLDAWIVMPNHTHALIVIDKPDEPPTTEPNRFGSQSGNLAAIVRGYKISVTRYARQQDIPFTWQPRYHDHIVRNANEHERIVEYIRTNPQRWAEDRFYESSEKQ